MNGYSNNSDVKKTPKNWSRLYSIRFISTEGFDSNEMFEKTPMTAEEFLTKAACSTVEKAENTSRRAAKQTLRKINKFLN